MFTKQCLSMLSILLIWSSLSYARLDPQSYQKMNEQVNRIEQKMANLPANEKKIDSSVLDKINEMTEDKALSKYQGSEIVRRYSSSLVKVNAQGKIRVVISLFNTTSRSIVNQLKNDLEKQNVQILGVYFPDPNINWYPEITGYVPYEKMKEIAQDERIANISVTTNPSSYSTTSQGDTALSADDARQLWSVDGGTNGGINTPIKVGVISDGIQGWNQAEVGGSFGYLSGHNETLGSEGVAMSEIIHDLAPGAELWFGSAMFGTHNPAQMRTTIDQLIQGPYACNIIVDDVYWPDEPWFTDGPLAQHISNKIAFDDITYVSAAGNDAKTMWTGLFLGDGDNWLIFYNENQYDFIQNSFTVPDGDSARITLQWEDDWVDAPNNYDLFVFDNFDNLVASSTTVQETGNNAKPIEIAKIINNTGVNVRYNIQVKKINGADVHLKVLVDDHPWDLDFTHSQFESHPSEQIVGHAAADGVISVAAYP